MERQPTQVPIGAEQVGEVRARWAWVEASVWTDRMLTALEDGVKGGKWFSLMAEPLLCRARVVLHSHSPCSGLSVPSGVNH